MSKPNNHPFLENIADLTMKVRKAAYLTPRDRPGDVPLVLARFQAKAVLYDLLHAAARHAADGEARTDLESALARARETAWTNQPGEIPILAEQVFRLSSQMLGGGEHAAA